MSTKLAKASRLLALLSFIGVLVSAGSMECGAVGPLRGGICGALAAGAFALFSYAGGLIG